MDTDPCGSAMMNFIRFYVTFNDEKMNLMFDEKVEELVTSKNIPMGVEEILLEQAEEKGLEEGLEKGRNEERARANLKLKESIRNMLREGFDVSVICKVLEVSKDFVQKIQSE